MAFLAARAALPLVLAAALLAGCGSDGDAGRRTPGDDDRSEAAKLASRLSPEQLVGQRLIASFRGTTVPPAALVKRIEDGGVAGVLLFGENAPTVAAARKLVARLQAIKREPPLQDVPLAILVDQEGGLVRRLRDAPPRRSALAAARAGSEAGIRAEGRRTAAALKRAGITVDLAPVTDVPGPGSALLDEQRTYGTSAGQVRRFAAAFTRGLVAGGVDATAKHFPGFGAATVNTDQAPATIRRTAAQLRTTDEPAVRAATDAGARLVMLANAVYPALDRLRPATLSREVATDELRTRFGFTGVSITDDLQAGALKRYGGPGTLAILSARAGVDLLVFGSTYEATEEAADALEGTGLPQEETAAAAARVLALRGV